MPQRLDITTFKVTTSYLKALCSYMQTKLICEEFAFENNDPSLDDVLALDVSCSPPKLCFKNGLDEKDIQLDSLKGIFAGEVSITPSASSSLLCRVLLKRAGGAGTLITVGIYVSGEKFQKFGGDCIVKACLVPVVMIAPKAKNVGTPSHKFMTKEVSITLPSNLKRGAFDTVAFNMLFFEGHSGLSDFGLV